MLQTVLIYANFVLHGLGILSVFAVQNLRIHGLKQTFKAWWKKYWWNSYSVGKIDEAHNLLLLLLGTDSCA